MTVELVVFLIFAAIALAGALTMVLAANPVRSALGLMAAMLSVAVFYILNEGHFIAATQVLIYAGAVMTLFLFVIMFIGVDQAEDRTEKLPGQRQLTIVLSVAFAAIVIVAGAANWITATPSGRSGSGTAEAIADELFGRWILAFELTAVLVIIAGAGTIALAQYRPRRRQVSADDAVATAEPAAAEPAEVSPAADEPAAEVGG